MNTYSRHGAGLIVFDSGYVYDSYTRLLSYAETLGFQVNKFYVAKSNQLDENLLQLVCDVKKGEVELILAESADLLLKETDLTVALREELKTGALHIFTIDGIVDTRKGLEVIARYDWLMNPP